MGNPMSHLDNSEDGKTPPYGKVDKFSLTLPRIANKGGSSCQRTKSSGATFHSTPNVYIDDCNEETPSDGRRLSRKNIYGSIPNKLEGSQERIGNAKPTKNEERNGSKKNRNCLILKDVNPKDWKKVIKTLPSVKHLSLSTIWFVSLEKFAENAEALAIAETLNVGKKLCNLKSLSLQEVSYPLNFDNLFTFRNHMNNLAELELSNLKIIFSDVDSLAGFSLSLNAHAQSTNAFKLFIRSCKFEVLETDLEASCLMLMSLTSRNRMRDITDLVSMLKTSEFEVQDNLLHQLRMDFVTGTLSSLLIDHVSFASSCEDVTLLFKKWNFRSIPRKANFEKWHIKCPKAERTECSSLLALLSVAAYQDTFFEPGAFVEKEKTEIDFGSAVFFPENFSFLRKTLETSFPEEKMFHIGAVTSGMQFKEDSAIENHVDLSLHHIESLNSKGISFHLAKLTLKVDRSGWAFTKIRLTRDPISVKFSNGVEISWPRNSTKQSRIVSIEVHKIPDQFIEQVCQVKNQSPVKVSPVVFIDQKYDLPFDELVSVEMPFDVSDSKRRFSELDISTKNRVYTKHANDITWKRVPKSSISFNSNKFVYKSKKFSPVASISSSGETPLNPDDVIRPYLESCVYVTACSSDAFAMNFDCKKFTEEEAREFRVSTLSKIRKVGEMRSGDRIYGAIGGNLKIDERYGYDLEDDKRLIFHYPDPEHLSNPQEYRMLRIEPALDAEGTVTYYLSSSNPSQEARIETKLFHIRIKLLVVSTQRQVVSLEQTLDNETVKDILDVSGIYWPDLLRKLNVKSSVVAEIEDHNLGDVLLETKRRLSLYQRKNLLLALFSSGGKTVTDIDAVLQKLNSALDDQQEEEVYWKLALKWLETAPRNVRNVKNLISCFQSSGLAWLAPSVEGISPGARHKAAVEVFRKFDSHRDKGEFIEEIGRFLIKQEDPSCKNMAFDLLLNRNR